MRRLHVQCRDQVGVLFSLSELLTRHGIDAEEADIAVIGGRVDNSFLLRAPRPSDFADADDWCRELEEVVLRGDATLAGEVPGKGGAGVASEAGGESAAESRGSRASLAAAAAAARLAVNPHLLCVSSFMELQNPKKGSSPGGKAGSPSGREQWKYRMEVKGINQAGLLAYLSMVLSQSGFNIRRAHIGTKDGQVSDTFELTASSADAPRRLQRHLDLPTTLEESPSLPQLQLLWAGESPHCSPTAKDAADGKGMTGRPGLADMLWNMSWYTSTVGGPGTEQRLCLQSGDIYEGALLVTSGNKGDSFRHGYGVYSYADPRSPYWRYSGQWQRNAKHGFGTLLLRDGSAYVGQWQDNERHGIGALFGYGSKGASGQAAMPTYRYEGEWVHDRQHGLGVEETEEYLYCGRFEGGSHHARGLKVHLRTPDVAACSALEGRAWIPLGELLAAGGGASGRRGAAREPYQALAGSYELAEDVSSAPAAQTFHFGKSSTRPGLAELCFAATPDAAAEEAGSQGRQPGKAAAASGPSGGRSQPTGPSSSAAEAAASAAGLSSEGPREALAARREASPPRVERGRQSPRPQ